MTDVFELVVQFRKSGDPALLGPIIKGLNEDVSLFLIARVPADDLADVRQNIFLQIIKGLHLFRGEKRNSLFAWLYLISRSEVARFYRSRARQPRTHLDYEALLEMVDRNAELQHLSEVDKQDAREAVEILRRADPDCFELLYERYVLELSLEEMGKQYGISADAAKMRIRRCEEKFLKG